MLHKQVINTALIGVGYWGKNILRNLVQHPQSGNIWVCDSSNTMLHDATAQYRIAGILEKAEQVFAFEGIDAVAIATPTSTHYNLAKQALLAGKHVLIEKPATTSSAQILELIKIATEKNLTLMVDHIYLYHPAITKLKEFVSNTEQTGNLLYVDSTRINLGIYQTDVNVLWDLACHDIAIINYLINERPTAVRTISRLNPIHQLEDLAYMFLHYQSGLVVHINASWASPVKMRKMILGAEKQMIIYDDIEPTNKLTIYDYEQAKATDKNKSKLTDYRLGNAIIPKFEHSEALFNVVNAFYQSIHTATPPIADGQNALEVIKVLEAAQKSIELGGEIVEIA